MEKVGSQVVQKTGIQCFNCKEYGHFAKECRKPKRVKDSAYHKEKMLLCKQAEQGVQLQAEQYDWLADTNGEVDEHELKAYYSYMAKIQEVPTADSGTDSEPWELILPVGTLSWQWECLVHFIPNKQELETHYSYMAKIQEVPNTDSGIDSEPVEQVQNDTRYNVFANALQHFKQSESVSNTCLVETDDSNVTPDSPNICEDDIQNDQNNVESDDERAALANLIANLKL
nr:hypothetical protein [Tanacetum cinerariifolium]